MQKALDDDEVKRKPENGLYVLNYRYKGGCNKPIVLERELNLLGWNKIADLTSCYSKKVTDKDSDLHHNDVERHLREHVSPNEGAEVRYGICKYIPRNQRPDNYEGIDTLFDEQ